MRRGTADPASKQAEDTMTDMGTADKADIAATEQCGGRTESMRVQRRVWSHLRRDGPCRASWMLWGPPTAAPKLACRFRA